MIGNMKADFRNSLRRYVIIIAVFAISTMVSSCGGGASTPATNTPDGGASTPTTNSSDGVASTPTTNSPIGQAKLAWDPPDISTDVAGYMIHYGTASGTYLHAIDVGNATSYTISNLIGRQTYYFAVTAYNAVSYESVYSNEVSITIAP